MKRSRALRSLSRDHHRALLIAQQMRRAEDAAEAAASLAEASATLVEASAAAPPRPAENVLEITEKPANPRRGWWRNG